MEATGSYWVRLAVTLHQAGSVVAVLNPKHVHGFAKSLPRRSKTDALDAHVLLRFAVERQPAPWTPPPAAYHELRQRLMVRDALMEMRQQARNQQHALVQWPVIVTAATDRFALVLATLDEQLAALDQEIDNSLNALEFDSTSVPPPPAEPKAPAARPADLVFDRGGTDDRTENQLVPDTLQLSAPSPITAAAPPPGSVAPDAIESGDIVEADSDVLEAVSLDDDDDEIVIADDLAEDAIDDVDEQTQS